MSWFLALQRRSFSGHHLLGSKAQDGLQPPIECVKEQDWGVLSHRGRKKRESTGSLIIPLTPREVEQGPGCSAEHAAGSHHRKRPIPNITPTFYRTSVR